MDRIEVAKNFFLDEFVDPFTYFTEEDHGLNQVNPVMYKIAQFVRDYFGKAVTINNWWEHKQGDRWPYVQPAGIHCFRGFRPNQIKINITYPNFTVPGAKLSMHRKGGAIDFNVSGLMTKEVHEAIERDSIKFYEVGVRRMESIIDATTWIHLDIKDIGLNDIHVFRA